MDNTNYDNVVTAPVVSEATGVDEAGFCSLAGLTFTPQRRCEVEAPHPDNGSRPNSHDRKDKPLGAYLTKNDILILDDNGYNLAERSTLRLKGGGGSENASFSTPLVSAKKRKVDMDNSTTSNKSEEIFSQCIDDQCDAIETVVAHTKSLIEDMIKEAKVARRWSEMLNCQLDEILIGSRRLGMAGSKILGSWSEQRVMLNESRQMMGDLHCDLGALREKHRALVSLHEECLDASSKDCVIVEPKPSTSAYPEHCKDITPPLEFMEIDKNSIQVISPSGKTYAKSVKNKRKEVKREAFPALKPVEVKTPKSKAPKRIKITQSKVKSKVKARETKVGSRFEVVGGPEAWKEVRKSVEQKISCPKVRILSNKAGVVLFPENPETLDALRRTGRLTERKPALPRLLVKGVDSMLEADLFAWSLGNQNPNLDLTEEDIKKIAPLYKTGPRDRVTVDWVIEAHPDTFRKLEGKAAYLGLTKCRMKLHENIPQCYRCQRYGHTAKTCRMTSPICRNCAGDHDSRECESTKTKCSNCKSTGHKASSKNCPAKLAAVRTVLRRTDFGTIPNPNV